MGGAIAELGLELIDGTVPILFSDYHFVEHVSMGKVLPAETHIIKVSVDWTKQQV